MTARECEDCGGKGCDECSQTGEVTTDMDELLTGRCLCANSEQWHESICPIHGGEVAAFLQRPRNR